MASKPKGEPGHQPIGFQCGCVSFSADLKAFLIRVQSGSELRGGTGSGTHARRVEGALVCPAQGHHTRIDQALMGKVLLNCY